MRSRRLVPNWGHEQSHPAPWDTHIIDQGLRAVTLLSAGLLARRFPEFGFGHKPKFTGHWHCTGGIFADVMEFACGRDHIVGRRPHGGSSELPEADAENILGVSR